MAAQVVGPHGQGILRLEEVVFRVVLPTKAFTESVSSRTMFSRAWLVMNPSWHTITGRRTEGSSPMGMAWRKLS